VVLRVAGSNPVSHPPAPVSQETSRGLFLLSIIIMNYWLLLIPVISAIIGWFGSWIAGKIFIYRIIPLRQQALAEKIGKAVSAEFSFADLEKKISDPDNVKKIMPLVEVHIDDFLRNKLKEKMPMISMFIGNKTIDSLKEVFLKEIEDLFPQVLKQFAGNLQSELNIEAMVTRKITTVRTLELEKMFSPALNYFQLAASLTGLIIGLINLALFLFIK
jgi:uncharacterized membrane protein YheB (UPF0754 family)